jgi:hypothetical protein
MITVHKCERYASDGQIPFKKLDHGRTYSLIVVVMFIRRLYLRKHSFANPS